MNRRKLVINYLIVALLAMSPITLAQTTSHTKHDWESLKTLSYETLLAIQLKDGTTVQGTLISIEGNTLKLYKTETSRSSGILHEEILNLDREKIIKVYRLDEKSGRKWTIIGAVAGAAVGAIAGSAAAGSIGNCNSIPTVFSGSFGNRNPVCGNKDLLFGAITAIGGGTVGAYVGHRLGRNRLKRILIYEA